MIKFFLMNLESTLRKLSADFFLIYILSKMYIMKSKLFFIFRVYILNILTLFFLHKIEIVRPHHFFFKNCNSVS